MEKARTSDKMSVGEKVFVFIAVMALVVCVTGLVAVGLTSMASWAICMTLDGLIVGWIVCIIGMTLYSSKNDPAAGICTHPEPTTCNHCGFPQPPPIRVIKDDQVRDQRYVYPDKCPHCGAPSGKSSAPDKSIEPPKFERYKENHGF